MKTTILKTIFLTLLLASFGVNADAQGFLKKVGKFIDNAASAVDNAATVAEGTADAIDAVTSSGSDSTSDNSDLAALENISYTVTPTYQLDEKGDTLLNEDGTKKLCYIVYDQDGKACDANHVKELLSKRRTEIEKVVAKVVGGAALGAGVSAVTGSGIKGILKGAAAGGVVGAAASQNNYTRISALNDKLSAYEEVIKAYQTTFTEEGLPIDVNADLSNVNGIDFTKDEPITRLAAEVAQELADSKSASLDDIDLSNL